MQLTLDFNPNLTQRFKTLREVVQYVLVNGKQSAVAAEMDWSPSELSRRVWRNADDSRSLDIDDFVRMLEVTGDPLPIHWLITKFLPDDETKRKAGISALQTLLPQIMAALELANEPSKASLRVAK